MVRKKIDNRIRVLIENGVAKNHRSMFVIVGDHGKDQVVILHHMLSKAVIKARPSVLWCYSKELGFSSHRKKRMKQLQKKIKSAKLDVNEDDPFELFIAATNIRYCYYKETHKILGNTYGMCVLQDFEAMQPNLLARTIETVEGGGLVIILLRTMTSLKQLYTMTMDVHARFRTEAHQDVVGRFNERFLLSLASCPSCMVIDDQLNHLPISSHVLHISPVPVKSAEDSLSPEELELRELKDSNRDTQPLGAILNCCRTLDQANAVLKFIDAITEKTLRNTVVMTAARGRGKSAALGLAMASAVAFGYSNIFVTAPSPENLKTLFEFIFKGFDALAYQEHLDYDIIQSTDPELNKAVVRVNIFKEHRQTIQYICPSDAHKLGQAELVCIDEAAAIPLPIVQKLFGPYLIFMSSTVNGYEGTGRSLSLKLVQQLRVQSATVGSQTSATMMTKSEGLPSASGRSLHEIVLNESIRYANGDPVEKWLSDLLCLDVMSVPRILSGCPLPDLCDLYYVNRDTLFSYHKASEAFLHRIMSLYVSSHYKNTPNDLQMLSDAPAHHIFVLLGPTSFSNTSLPEVLCVLQVSLEGEISKSNAIRSLEQGRTPSGDLIPWTVTQQFLDTNFASLSGARIVRIATHPDYQRMGYGGRAVSLLQQYFEGRIQNLSEEGEDATTDHSIQNLGDQDVDLLSERLTSRKNLPPLLLKLSDRKPERLDYLGVSFGMTYDLLKFWKLKAGFAPVYLRQTANDLTGEHSCIMLKLLNPPEQEVDGDTETTWLESFWKDFRNRFLNLLSRKEFRAFKPAVALEMLHNKQFKDREPERMSAENLYRHLSKQDLKRLNRYRNDMADYHLIMDLLPTVAQLYFHGKIDVHLSKVQMAVLLGLGLQHKSVEELQLEMPGLTTVPQLLGNFKKALILISKHFDKIVEADVESKMVVAKEITMTPVSQSLEEDLNEGAAQVKKRLADMAGFEQYTIKGSEDEWNTALSSGSKQGLVSVKSTLAKKRQIAETFEADDKPHKKHKKQKKRKDK